MAFREVSVVEVREVLRGWLAGAGLRTVAAQAGVDRKTARRYVQAAEAAGVAREGGFEQVTDAVIGEVVAAVRPGRPAGHGSAWQQLEGQQEQITVWVKRGLTVVKIGVLLERRGVVVPYRTLHRFCVQCCGFGRGGETVRVLDGDPGVELQVDFGQMGLLPDPASGRRRLTQALIFTAVYSRHMFVWLAFSQTLDAVIAGCEQAWGVLRWGVQGPDPGQHVCDRRRRRSGQSEADRGLVGLRAALRVRHRHRPGPARERQTSGGADRALCPVELLGR